MKKEKKEYKRSYKNLVIIFVMLVFAVLSMLLSCFTMYYAYEANTGAMYAFYGLQIISNVIISVMLTFLLLSRFNKYSAKEIIDNAPKKIIFALAAFVFTILFSWAGCCCMWYIGCC